MRPPKQKYNNVTTDRGSKWIQTKCPELQKRRYSPFNLATNKEFGKKRHNPLPKRRKDHLGDTFLVRFLLQVFFCQIDFTLNWPVDCIFSLNFIVFLALFATKKLWWSNKTKKKEKNSYDLIFEQERDLQPMTVDLLQKQVKIEMVKQ